jgi:hypothetical protein
VKPEDAISFVGCSASVSHEYIFPPSANMAMLKELNPKASSKGGKAKPDSERSRKAHNKNRSGCKTCK